LPDIAEVGRSESRFESLGTSTLVVRPREAHRVHSSFAGFGMDNKLAGLIGCWPATPAVLDAAAVNAAIGGIPATIP
jgi:hypothetical protein